MTIGVNLTHVMRWGCVLAALCACAIATSVRGPLWPFLIVAAFLCGAVLLSSFTISYAALVVVAFVTFPAALMPETFPVGVYNFNIYEPLLVAGLWAKASERQVGKSENCRAAKWPVVMLTLLAIAYTGALLMGLARGNELSKSISDWRGIFPFAAAFAVAIRAVKQTSFVFNVKLGMCVIYISFAVLLCAQWLNFDVSGREERAQLWSTDGTTLGQLNEATRFLTPTSLFATLFLALLPYAIRRFPHLKVASVVAGLMCIYIIFLSYSRNQLVALSVAILVMGILTLMRRPKESRLLPSSAIVIFGAVLLSTVPNMMAPDSNSQVSAYTSRVVLGLLPSNQAIDSSAQDRASENDFLVATIKRFPIGGSGFGYAYKPSTGPAGGFAADEGRYYAHNYYLWLWAKGGPLAVLVFVGLLASVVWGCIRSGKRWGEVGAAAIVALAAVCTVAPLPNNASNGILLAGVLGLLSKGISVSSRERLS